MAAIFGQAQAVIVQETGTKWATREECEAIFLANKDLIEATQFVAPFQHGELPLGERHVHFVQYLDGRINITRVYSLAFSCFRAHPKEIVAKPEFRDKYVARNQRIVRAITWLWRFVAISHNPNIAGEDYVERFCNYWTHYTYFMRQQQRSSQAIRERWFRCKFKLDTTELHAKFEGKHSYNLVLLRVRIENHVEVCLRHVLNDCYELERFAIPDTKERARHVMYLRWFRVNSVPNQGTGFALREDSMFRVLWARKAQLLEEICGEYPPKVMPSLQQCIPYCVTQRYALRNRNAEDDFKFAVNVLALFVGHETLDPSALRRFYW